MNDDVIDDVMDELNERILASLMLRRSADEEERNETETEERRED